MTRWIAVASLLLSCLSCHREPSRPTIPSDSLDGRSGATTPAATTPAGTTPAGGTTTPPTSSSSSSTSSTSGALTPEAACARFDKLSGEGCDWTHRFPPQFRETGTCVTSLASWVAPSTPEHEKLEQTIGCWALDCDAAAACMVKIQSSAPPPPPRRCGDEGTAPIFLPPAEWSARPGATAKKFSDVSTTAAAPVEACGIEGELEWMTRTVCNDGSNPYGSLAVAHDSRDSWLARGGRCNSVLDRFSVRCPEATYQVYVDRYVCPRTP